MYRKLALLVFCGLIAAVGVGAASDAPIDIRALGFEPFNGHRYVTTDQAADAVPFTLVKSDFVDMLYQTTGDFDNDGYPDLIFSGWMHGTYIAWGNGDGSFATPSQLNADPMTAFATGYVDGDGYLDVIAITAGTLRVWLNNGDGTFTVSTVGSPTSNYRGIITGYFNADTYLDVVVTPGDIYFGDGSGGFPTIDSLPISNIDGGAVADFDLDGDDDIAVTSGPYVWLLLNDGTGTFTASDSVITGQGSVSVSTAKALADFNRDGYPDFATITPLIGIDRCTSNDYWRSVVTVAFGDGAGSIASTDTFSVCGTSYLMAVTDVDRDGELDFAIANGSTHEMEVFLGDGAGDFTWSFARSFETDSITFALCEEDLDRDGNPDFVAGGGLPWGDTLIGLVNGAPDPQLSGKSMTVTGYGATLALETPGSFEVSRLITTAAGAKHIRRDINADGTLDEAAFEPTASYGDYQLLIDAAPGAARAATFDADVTLSDGTQAVLFRHYPTPSSPIVFTYPFEASSAISPASGAPTNGQTPVFDWGGLVPGGVAPDMYEFQLDGTYDFSSPTLLVDETGLSVPQYATSAPLNLDEVYYWRVRWYADGVWSDYTPAFAAYVNDMLCGDANGDGQDPNIADVAFMVAYIFQGGPAPSNPGAVDVNGDATFNIADITYFVWYLFNGGDALKCL